MGYHPRFESDKYGNLITTRTRNSELWFVNNPRLEQAILGYAAKTRKRYNVKLYALAITGNHIHATAVFPEMNRSKFMRDFNSATAKAVIRYTPEYPGGRFWGRRYSAEILPDNNDIEDRFFYTVLQPVQDGLVERISDFPGYNCFHDAIWGIKRKFKVMNRSAYYEAKRYRKEVRYKDFIEEIELEYERLPGYEDLSQKEYAMLMLEKLEARRVQIVQARRAKGLGFAGKTAIRRTKRGSRPRKTKVSDWNTPRPRILCLCPDLKRFVQDWYFAMYYQYKEASLAYRSGNRDAQFPPGTYKPCVYNPPLAA